MGRWKEGSNGVQDRSVRITSHLILIGLMMVIVPLQTVSIPSFNIINKVV